ncbi:MAG: hypothetical protein ACFE0I_00735 [Elainellaceae cyanobacterium]
MANLSDRPSRIMLNHNGRSLQVSPVISSSSISLPDTDAVPDNPWLEQPLT